MPASDIVLHLVGEHTPSVRVALSRSGVTLVDVPAHLRHRYCNKLSQLTPLLERGGDEFVLLDCDTVLRGPLPLSRGVLRGKPVDLANPPLGHLSEIFAAAGLDMPIAPTDLHGSPTARANVNGGLYVLDAALLVQLADAWPRWADWCLDRQALFGEYSAHVDQVAVALAVAEGDLPFAPLDRAFNFPTHLEQTDLLDRDPILLHYHSAVTPEGLLRSEGLPPLASLAVARVNERLLAAPHDSDGRLLLRAAPEGVGRLSGVLRSSLRDLRELGGRLILHAGTPKTGTTSLQQVLDRERHALAAQGICYPSSVQTVREPKHQWLVQHLMARDPVGLDDRLAAAVDEAVQQRLPVVVLSTEGLFNHWIDYREWAASWWRAVADEVDLSIWVLLREPTAFAVALHQQYLKNPCNGIGINGLPVSIEQALGLPTFIDRLDYRAFVAWWEGVVGIAVDCDVYDGDSVRAFTAHLGLTTSLGAPVRANRSWGGLATELLEVMNRFALSGERRGEVLEHIAALDAIVQSEAPGVPLDREVARLIQELVAPSLRQLVLERPGLAALLAGPHAQTLYAALFRRGKT